MTKPRVSSPNGLESLLSEEPTDSSLRRVSGIIIGWVRKGGGGEGGRCSAAASAVTTLSLICTTPYMLPRRRNGAV